MTTVRPWIAVVEGPSPPRWVCDAIEALSRCYGPPQLVLARDGVPLAIETDELRADDRISAAPVGDSMSAAEAIRRAGMPLSVWLGGPMPLSSVVGELWWVGFGAPGAPLSSTPGLAELDGAHPVSGASLVRQRDGVRDVIATACVRTVDVSVQRQIGRVLDVASQLAWRAARCPRSEPAPAIVPGMSPGRIRELKARAWARYGLRQLDETVRADVWNVGIIDAPIARLLDPAFVPAVRWLPPPPQGTFLADPFGVRTDTGLRIFAEALVLADDVGEIVAFDVADDGTVGPWRECLRASSHLSYPFVVDVGDETWLVPESSAERHVTAWRLDPVELELREPHRLLDGFAAIDPSIVAWNGRWWMFATDAGCEPVNALHIFHADSPLGPWQPHAGNPVKVDVRSSRPGGTPFVVDGVLYRPAQDCSTGYGAAVSIERVDELTPASFSEHTVRRVLPHAARPQGLHTLSAVGDVTLVDGSRRDLAPARAGRELVRKLRRLRG